MNFLQRKNIREGEEGPEYDCIYCAAENVLDDDPDQLIDTRCHSCARLQTINHSFPIRLWEEVERKYLEKHFPHNRTADCAFELKRSSSAVQQQANKMKIRKSAFFMRSKESGKKIKGEKAWNKGISYMPGGRCAEGWFKDGHIPYNTKEDGFISVRLDKSGRPYPHIRLHLGVWKMLHVHIWEENNGPTPEGMIIVFKDGDTFNPDLSNLELITRAENMQRNTIHRFPAELKEQIRLLAKLERKIKSISNAS